MTTIVKDSYTLMLGDCLGRMREIPDGSVDMVLADLPYGTTTCKWDTVIDFEPLWAAYWRVLKPRGAVVLFAGQPFTSALVSSQIDSFKYEMIWQKDKPSNFALANKQPMKYHENICVFYKAQPTFNKQMTDVGVPQHSVKKARTSNDGIAPNLAMVKEYGGSTLRNPSSILPFSCVRGNSKEKTPHPTQKPVALLEYLVLTYTNAEAVVLDNTMGSGSTGVAALRLGRSFIGIEKEPAYFEIAAERLSLAQSAGTTLAKELGL